MLQTKINQNLLIAGLIFLVVFAIFIFTLAPGLYTEDSAEFITASATLGIPHPSGYPTYTLLGFVFSKIPLGEIPWRINLMSAFFGALTAGLLYLLIKKIGQRLTDKNYQVEIVSVLSALTFAFSQTFWRESIVAEVYSLNAFFTALTLLLAVNFYQTREKKYLYPLCFFFGLGLTNHYSLLTLGPAYLLLSFLRKACPRPDRGQESSLKHCSLDPRFRGDDTKTGRNNATKQRLLFLAKSFAFFLLGLLPYLYLPLRARAHPLLNWFSSQTLTFNLADGLHFTSNLLKYLPELLNNYQYEFTWPLLIIALLGIYFLLKKDRGLGIFLLLAFLLTGLGPIIALTHGAAPDFFINWFLNIIFIPHYLILAILIAAGFGQLAQWLKPKCFYACLAIFGALTFFLLISNFPTNNLSQKFLVDDYARAILKNLPENSVLIIKEDDLNEDTIIFSLAYLKMAEKQRPDVLIISDTPVFKPPAELKLNQTYLSLDFKKQKEILAQAVWENIAQPQNRPLFITSPAFFIANPELQNNRELRNDFFSCHSRESGNPDNLQICLKTSWIPAFAGMTKMLSNGNFVIQGNEQMISWPTHCLYQIAPQSQKPNLQFCPLFPEEKILGLKNDWGFQLLASKIWYDQAAFWQTQGQKQKASVLLQKAIATDPFPMSARYQEFVVWRSKTPSSAQGGSASGGNSP